MNNIKYTDLLKMNNQLGKTMSGETYEIRVISNIITSQLNEILEFILRTEKIRANVKSGDYDNIPQDSGKFNESDSVCIFWEPANLIDGFQYKANTMGNEEIDLLLDKVTAEIDLVISSLERTSLIIWNSFSSLVFNCNNIRDNTFDRVCKELNDHLRKKIPSNTVLIDIDKVISKVSIEKSVDFRYYYSSKALYTINFYKEYARYIKPVISAANGKAKKAIIFDCDNTLWKGVLGEDGFNGIETSAKAKNGVVFEEIQYIALDLNKRGILIGLCSKNNGADVDEVIQKHPDMILREKDISIKKVNWNDKVTNLVEIARELSIGLDSLVFVDDSEFECNLVKEQLPDITVIKVPERLHEFPTLLRENGGLFFYLSETTEDLKRVKMYKEQAGRENAKLNFKNLEDFLKTLGLQINIFTNDESFIPRISQLTQKTNQFNLTTARYTEADIKRFINSGKHKIVAFDVLDKFGSYGLTGLFILELSTSKMLAKIDTFLMSCRIIGRNIELAVFDWIVSLLKENGIETLEAEYIKTFKNSQVENFYDRIGFGLAKQSDGQKQYILKLSEYKSSHIEYIKIGA